MGNIRRISKKHGLRQIVTFFLVCCMFCNPAVLAEVVHTSDDVGSITVTPLSGGTTQSMTATNGAIGNFSDFDIALGHTVTCVQGGSNNNALFKVGSEDGTQIYGMFSSDGNIYLQDLRGILIGSTGQINTHEFVASTVNIKNSDWQDFVTGANNQLKFEWGVDDPTGVMENQGTISASKVYLIGSQVLNSGIINAPDTLVMAAGEKIYLTHEDSKVLIKVPTDLVTPDPVTNKVDIDAASTINNAGQVVLAAGDIFTAAMDVDSLAATANRDITIEGNIDVFNYADSDAVSTVVLDAGHDVTIDGRIWARADVDTGDADDDAISTIDIDAGGNVYNNGWVRAQADVSSGSGNGEVTIDVYAEGDVIMNDGRFSAGINAGDRTADLNKAKVVVDATNVILENGSQIDAGAQPGIANTAEVIIKATEDVKVTDSQISTEVHDTDGSNTATVDITAGGVVNVTSEYNTAKITSVASDTDEGSTANNSANIKITAGSVKVQSNYEYDAYIEAYAELGATNKADVTITTNGDGEEDNPSGDVEVISNSWSGEVGYAGITALAGDSLKNEATVTIDATGDVEVIARGGGIAEIRAEAMNWLYDSDTSGRENIALVDIDADGRVLVKAENGYSGDIWWPSYAAIAAKAQNILQYEPDESEGSFTEQVDTIDVTFDGLTNTADVDIDAAKVEVLSYYDAEAEIFAEASNRWDEDEPDYSLNIIVDNLFNTATVDITTVAVEDDEQYNGDVKIKAHYGDYAGVSADAFNGILEGQEPESGDVLPENVENIATVTLDTDGEIEVDGYYGGAAVTAYTSWGIDNTSNVGITADDDLNVESVSYEAEGVAIIEAIAENGVDNTAGVAIDVVGGDVTVKDIYGDTAKIAATAQNAFNSNNADIQITATAVETIGEEYIGSGEFQEYVYVEGGNVEVVSGDYGHAEISATAKDGVENNASVGVCADGDVIVAAGIYGIGGSSMIKAEAGVYEPVEGSTANAEVTVVSHNGGVGVIDFAGDGQATGTALIKAYAHDAYTNTADVGIVAGGFLEDFWPEEEEGVFVWSSGEGSVAGILALAQDGFENTADVVICTPFSVEVWNQNGHIAGIGAIAWGEEADNSATTQVYARRLWVGEDAYIGAWAQGEDPKFVEFTDGWLFPGDPQLDIATGDGDNSTLILDTYENRKDCPDCEEEQEEEEPIPSPPLYWPAGLPLEREEFAQGGCPVLMAWLADEIGVPAEDIDVVVADVFALSTDIQPCDTCARLMNASKILQDTEGTRIGAMARVVNEFVTTPAPPSPEQMTQIAAAFAEHVGDGTHYAAAGQWIDAIVAYVNIMRTEMGFSATESVAFAQKYLAPVTGSGNAALNAYVQARLAALGS